ncbi:hypothetical protein CH63R_07706 [Colletotrichum higginsianum IMI 349063]|uniref:Uncharacterized protein n=1 Tax=Colletotrichum higginsianum (strain IMI 349063) TaxID=759273 RepID=A0A1B7YA16_COLHI|nr:hypothetical protein CH63R_07706 [Colletotrichum higginsianum IMI 349063]OBR08941.1 hypothetical protein CH63R_07706 [Colletotrichum higginsianum IMI 349063]GJC97000.1 hypothetical protein ColKHC_05826 [Colletotrichum higginsianum]
MGYCKNAWSDDYVKSAFSLMTNMAKSGFWGTMHVVAHQGKRLMAAESPKHSLVFGGVRSNTSSRTIVYTKSRHIL